MNNIKRVKVVHIITRLDVGGSSTNTIETVARLDPSRYDVLLISGRTDDPQGTIVAGLKQRNIRYEFIDDLRRNIDLFKDLEALIKLYRRIKKERCAIVHTHSSKAGILGRWAAKWAGVPIIIHTPHGHIFYGYFNRIVTGIFVWIERAAAKFTDRIVTLTERGRREHVEFKIGPLEKFIAIPSGIDIHPARFSEEDTRQLRGQWIIPSERFIFGTVARLDPIKGIPYLVQAMAEVVKAKPDSQLLIVGDGEQKQELQASCERLGIKYHVTFTGHQNNVGRFMEMMDVFVLPSLNEGMGRVLLDAMVLSKAVIASNVGGIPDVVDDGKTGLLVPAKDPQALAQAMLRLRNDAALTAEFGRQGHKKVTEGFSLDSMVQKIAGLYEECLAQKKI